MGGDALNKDIINIEIISDWYDCETCGYSEDITLIVRQNGTIVCEATHDGHFGGGESVGDEDGRITMILESLGYDVTIEHREMGHD